MASLAIVPFHREPHIEFNGGMEDDVADPFSLLRLEHWKAQGVDRIANSPDMFDSLRDEASRAFRELARKCHPDYYG